MITPALRPSPPFSLSRPEMCWHPTSAVQATGLRLLPSRHAAPRTLPAAGGPSGGESPQGSWH